MIRSFNRTILLITAVLFVLSPLFAEGGVVSSSSWGIDAAYYIDDHAGLEAGSFVFPDYTPSVKPDTGDYTYGSGDEGRDLGSGWGGAELQAWFKHSIKVPFLAGEGPLSTGNNLNFIFKANLAPVIAGFSFSTVWTPLALLQLEIGTHAGTGWAGFGFNGMGLNSDGSGIASEDSFKGMVSKSWLAGTFQFDLAAVMPGDWNHLVIIGNGKIEYQNYSLADNDEAWVWEVDAGENFNSFRYKGTYLFGYQMPLRVNTVGLLFETEERLGNIRTVSTMDSDGWGSDFRKVRIAPLAVIGLTDNSSLTLLFQFSNGIRYTEETIYNRFFQNRSFDDIFWKFRRIAFSYSAKL